MMLAELPDAPGYASDSDNDGRRDGLPARRSGTNLHIVRNGVVFDSRVLKETEALEHSGLFESLEIAGFEVPGYPEFERLGSRRLHRVGIRSRWLPKDLVSQFIKFGEWKFRVVNQFKRLPLRVIHCHDLEPLPIATKLKRITGARVIYDAHELETERTGAGGIRQKIMRATERHCMRYVDGMITVSPSIQEWYRKAFPGVPVALVRNIPDTVNVAGTTDLRAKFRVPKNALLFIFQGGHGAGRSIDAILRAFSQPSVFHHVVFMGEGALASRVRELAGKRANVHWHPPVAPEQVLSTTASADVGLSLIEDISLSYRYSLPNKLFEYWFAGIPVVASAIPDQSDLVNRYKAGWVVSPSERNIVEMLGGMDHAKVRSVEAGVKRVAREMSWGNEAKVLVELYRNVLRTNAYSTEAPR